ncbi:hypothetical protein B0H34DRAFT_197165 [Crassisporium funariophilum]|nr:hypothetical protein B0H34DRAFT_197165 [Crassisporium funariophilum]
MGAGSCAFDLASRLSLLPGQINSHLAEYDEGVPIDDIVTRGSCYCGRISRHGLIYLVSQHLQNISLSETSTGTKCIAISTSLGRFKCYEKDDRTFVHFDGTTRSSYLPLVRDQNLEEILQTAQGQYLINDSAEHRDFIWRQSSMDALEYLATGNFYGIPNAIMYMPRETLDRWKRLKQFSWAMADAMLSVIETVHEPASFVLALNNLPKGSSAGLKNKLAMESPAEKLAACVYLCRVLSRKSITEMDFEYFHMYARMNMQDLTEAHQLYRSPRAESSKLFSTSQDRFMRLLREYTMVDNASGRHSDPSLRTELQGLLLSNRNNVALVVFQGFLAIVSLWNSSRVLMRAREAPEEWIRFVVADDDDVFLG